MPVAQPSQLNGPGTFSQTVVPPTNAPVTVAASGSINVAPNSQGYVVITLSDTISGRVVAGIADMIRPAEQAIGVKNFNLSASSSFTAAVNLVVSVSTRQLDGADPSTAPVISGASLSAFAANPVAEQV
jgi:hypothetical protein